MDRGAWLAVALGVAKSQTQLSDSHTVFFFFNLNLFILIGGYFFIISLG